MPDSKRFLHPEAIERIARLELRARHIVEGFLSGMHRSPYFGQSVEFLQHREYIAGRRPAPRRLESLGQAGPLLRQAVRGRHEPPRTLLVDVSDSMQYGSRPAEQVRIRLHDRREPGLSAAAAARRRGLRGLRRADSRQHAACAAAQPSERRSSRRSTPASPQRQDRPGADARASGRERIRGAA